MSFFMLTVFTFGTELCKKLRFYTHRSTTKLLYYTDP